MTTNETLAKLPRRTWSNWLVLASSYLVTTGGLALALVLLLPGRMISPWPWVRTDYALIAACLFMVITLVVHLSLEQRHTDAMHRQFLELQEQVYAAGRRRLYALLGVSRIMGIQSDLQHVFESIVAACREAFPCDHASLMLFDANRKRLVVRAASGHVDPSRIIGSEKELGEGVAGWVAEHRTPLVLGGPGAPPAPAEVKLSMKHLSAAIVVPIILRDELVGVINISSSVPDTAYERDDLHALEVFAENAGACIRHAEQAEWLRKTVVTLREQVESPGRAPRAMETHEARRP